MTIYVDDPMPIGGHFNNWCHMWTDGDVAELNEMARSLNIHKRGLMHSRGKSGDFWHYDISPSRRRLALELGAKYMRLRDWIAQQNSKRKAQS